MSLSLGPHLPLSFPWSLYSALRKHATELYNAHGVKKSPFHSSKCSSSNRMISRCSQSVSVPHLISDQLWRQSNTNRKHCFLALGRNSILTRKQGEMQGRHQASIYFPEGRAVLSISCCQHKPMRFAPRPSLKEQCLKESHNIYQKQKIGKVRQPLLSTLRKRRPTRFELISGPSNLYLQNHIMVKGFRDGRTCVEIQALPLVCYGEILIYEP